MLKLALPFGEMEDLPDAPLGLPPGWMTAFEMKVLYNFARRGSGDFLEIGTWIGRSSTAIAMGFRDAGPTDRRLDMVDLGFVSMADFDARLHVGNDKYLLRDEVCRPIMAPGGVIAGLIENLRARDLLRYVTSVIRGDVADVPLRSSYGVVFCDAVHNVEEIAVTGPVLARILRPGAWLVCDDLCEAALVDALERHLKFDVKTQLREIDPASKAMVGRVIEARY